ncbi:hypothetical protein MKW94_001981 [Papaver nudicaule]|uniref:BHLH domain-containing protein n=1 Tax=Papaver nudicaule TaxID=74823 RepID=A0AA41RVX1_PAPNU|nr:hypothetical protein [Papaver nudicaule]
MGMNGNGDLEFQQRLGMYTNLITPPSGMCTNLQAEKVAEEITLNQISISKSTNGADSFFHTGWDPVSQAMEFKGSIMDSHHQIGIPSLNVDLLENQRIGNSSHHVLYPSDPNLMELEAKLPSFGSGSFTDMLAPFCIPESRQFVHAGSLPGFPSNKETTGNTNSGSGKVADHGVIFQEEVPVANECGRKPLYNGKKRKRVPDNPTGDTHSQLHSTQSMENEQRMVTPMEANEDLKGQDERKQRNKQNPASEPKDNSQNEEAPKEDYVHVRARRGQATNSHSLAERVRREKISERMKLLQDLVPGCDKVTGKALMLDEIINYVQSLQRQVEFLSMKLATVNPDINVDMDRIISKDILHSHAGGSAILGFAPGMNSSHSHPHLFSQTMQPVQRTDVLPLSIPQVSSVWVNDNELQSVLQMNMVSDPDINNLGSNAECLVLR